MKKYQPKMYDDDKLKNKCGIYQIRNLKNNKIYVGSSNNLFQRKNYEHLKLLKKNNHFNEHLQNAWNIYGAESFVFEIIEFCKPEEKIEKEQYWIDFLGVLNKKNGYNIRPEASGNTLSMETKQKLRDINKNKKGVVCIELNKSFISIKEASRQTGVNDSQIIRCCKGKNDTAGGYHWKYEDSNYIKYKNKPKNNIEVMCLETGKKYKSIKEASIKNNIDYSTICDVISNKKSCYTAGGYHWVKVDEKTNFFDILLKDKRKKPIVSLIDGEIYTSFKQLEIKKNIKRKELENLDKKSFIVINNNIYADLRKVLTSLIFYAIILLEV